MNKKRLLIIIVIVAAAVLLSILFDSILANHQPAITSLEAEPERVLPLRSCQIVCNATDRDGDELSYNWSASGGRITGEGATVTWTAPDSIGSYNITVIVIDGRGGEDMDKVTIEVRANKPPIITSLIADADWTTPSSSIQVTCDASDADGDGLSYEWTATAGNITGTGAAVNWTAPQEVGIYDVTVVVTDVHGGSATDSLLISVVTGQPPVIEDLTVTAREPKYLIRHAGYYTVGQTKEYDIECIVADAGTELSYNWSCEDGEISGKGSMITWTAPDKYVRRTAVTVMVSDVAGNSVAKSMYFEVASCTSCTFR